MHTHFIAIPATGSNMTPIPDFTVWMLIVGSREADRINGTKLYVQRLSPRQMVDTLLEAHVKTVICGCLSNSLYESLVRSEVNVVWGVTGPISTVIEAFEATGLDDARYRVVGLGPSHFRSFETAPWLFSGNTQEARSQKVSTDY